MWSFRIKHSRILNDQRPHMRSTCSAQCRSIGHYDGKQNTVLMSNFMVWIDYLIRNWKPALSPKTGTAVLVIVKITGFFPGFFFSRLIDIKLDSLYSQISQWPLLTCRSKVMIKPFQTIFWKQFCLTGIKLDIPILRKPIKRKWWPLVILKSQGRRTKVKLLRT